MRSLFAFPTMQDSMRLAYDCVPTENLGADVVCDSIRVHPPTCTLSRSIHTRGVVRP